MILAEYEFTDTSLARSSLLKHVVVLLVVPVGNEFTVTSLARSGLLEHVVILLVILLGYEFIHVATTGVVVRSLTHLSHVLGE